MAVSATHAVRNHCFPVASSKPTTLSTGLTLAHQTLIVPLTSPDLSSVRSSTRSSSCQRELKTDVEKISVDSGVSCGASFTKQKEQDRNVMRSVDNLVLCAPPMSTATVEFGGSIPNVAPEHSYHNDLYNTAFALHTLSSDGGWTDYLSQARSLWDGCLRPEFNGTDRAGSSEKVGVGRGKDGVSSEKGKDTDGGVSNGASTAAQAVGVGGAKTGTMLFYRHPRLASCCCCC